MEKMALVGQLLCARPLAKGGAAITSQMRQMSTKHSIAGKKWGWYAVGGIVGSGAALIGALEYSCRASGVEVSPYHHKWSHNGLVASYDHASIRRGWEVYKTVCASCHSIDFLPYRRLVNVCLTEEEAKAEAAAASIRDGPNEVGEYFNRPGRLADYVPPPYPNEQAARHANNGAYPPDLSFICLGRKGGSNYIFALLTGYTDAPAGIVVQEGQYFNPYFMGGAISMAQAIYNETVEFSDGTPASASQIAKDVTTFLEWHGQPYHDRNKKIFLRFVLLWIPCFAGVLYTFRRVGVTYKSVKSVLTPPRKYKK